VVTAGTGAEGIEYVKRWDFALVFLDLKLPKVDGAELLKQMRSAKPELLVTIIPGYPGSEMMERALKQGPFGVMNKPFDSPDIINAVNSFVKAGQPRR
jgi:DNA-binding NtrC family response regulator